MTPEQYIGHRLLNLYEYINAKSDLNFIGTDHDKKILQKNYFIFQYSSGQET